MTKPDWELPSPVDEYVKEQIRNRCLELGMTQRQLAKKLDVTQPSVANILSNRGGFIPGSLIRMLDALDLEIVVARKSKSHRAAQQDLVDIQDLV